MYKLISCKTIVGKMINLFNMPSGLQYDCIIWIADAIELLGFFNFVNKVKKVIVDNGFIELPCDFHYGNFIVYNGCKLDKGFKKNPNNYYRSKAEQPEIAELINLLKTDVVEDTCNSDNGINLQSLNKRVENLTTWLGKKPVINNSDNSYYYENAENGYSTNVEDGESVYLFYKGFPLDNEGFPMIIDEVKYRTAIEFYCMWQLMLKGYSHPTLKLNDVYELQVKSFKAASNQQLKMTWEQLDNFTSNWTNMLYSLRDNDNYYSN